MADIVTLPVQRKRGRRRVHPKPGANLATVIQLEEYAAETADQRLDRMREESKTIAYHLLMTVRAFQRAFPPEV